MDLSVIIVSWNVKALLQDCLQSLFHYSQTVKFEVIVIDNASTDGSVEMVRQHFPQVTVIANDTNRGFGAANNQGLKIAQGHYVLFLNDDTAISSDIFPALLKRFESYPGKLGMIGCRLLNPNGSLQPSVRAFPTWHDQAVVLLKLHHFFPRMLQHYTCANFDYEREQTVDQVMGAFMLAPRSLMNSCGGFDEDFFVWFEEVDLQHRLRDQGYDILYFPTVSCVHVKGQSFVQLRKPTAQRMFNKSMRTYFYKRHAWGSYLLVTLLQPLSLFLSYAIQAVR